MDSKHATLVRVLQRLEALSVGVANGDALAVVTDGAFDQFPARFENMSEYRYRIALDNANPENSTMVVKKNVPDSPEYKFICGNLFMNSSYYGDNGLFRFLGHIYPTTTLSTVDDAGKATDVLKYFQSFTGNQEPLVKSECNIHALHNGSFIHLIFHWSCEYVSITNEVSDLSSNMVFRADD